MNRKRIVDQMLSEKLVVIIRTFNQTEVATIIGSLVNAGVKILEITSNTPGFEEEISTARNTYIDVLVGAGTITNISLAQRAIEVGAQFLVTPNVNPEVVRFAHKFDVPVLMGALTPSEVCQGIEAGADIIKIFPADIFGVNYLKAIMAPLNNVPFFAVGGIRNENAAEWIKAGAAGLGVGGQLTEVIDGDVSRIYTSAKDLLEILKPYRS